jgi:pyruvate dehydrogenase E1 component alpha subunit
MNTLYYQMLRIRMVEEAIAREYPKQEMRCPIHLCIGQEAIAVGVCSVLQQEDAVFSTHRSHGHYLARGGSLGAMIAELYGKATGSSGGIGGSMHLIDTRVNFLGAAPIVASTIPVAVGVALSRVMQNKPGLSVCFFGDAAVEEGTAHEAMNFASLRRLPVLFVCENNLYSTVTPLAPRQPQRPIADIARGHGMKAFQADGQDVRVVQNVSRHAVDSIRRGAGGPVFIEFATYRFVEHCGPNEDAPALRPPKELAAWKKKDPIRFLSPIEHRALEPLIAKEITEAFRFAKESPFPTYETVTNLRAGN